MLFTNKHMNTGSWTRDFFKIVTMLRFCSDQYLTLNE